MFTLYMQTMLSDKWYNLGSFKTAQAANDHASWVREQLRGVKFQLTVEQ
jgi:hypothetical protein